MALYLGAGSLVKGSSSLALRLGLGPLMVGLTVVAFGTSTPELFVVTKAALDGAQDISIGNVIGANNLNVGVILGVTALVRPLRLQMQLVRYDVPIMIAASLVLVACLLDGRLGRGEGALLLAGIVAYTAFRIRRAPRERDPALVKEFETAVRATRNGIPVDLLLIVGGVGLLAIGARFLVAGALELAQILGVSDAAIAITVVAAGTTLPELITSLVAAARKAPDIAVGNIIGSNIFNILCVLGTAATLRPLDAPNIGSREIVAFLVMALVAWPVMARGLRVTRLEGLALVCSYLLMLGWMMLA